MADHPDDDVSEGTWDVERTDAIDSTPFRPVLQQQLKACLVVIAGPDLGRYYELQPAEYLIGRAETADIGLRDLGVSRYHARIIYRDQQTTLIDLGSANGLFVNGVRVTPQEPALLNEGDKIALGRGTILKLDYVDELDQQFQQDLLNAALRDALTGAFNKRYLLQTLRVEFAYARRHRSRLGLAMVDLDFFKRINDQYGHLAGDAVLAQFGQIVLQTLRIEDIFARYGGEEFALLCRGSSQSQIADLAERLRLSIYNTKFIFEGQTLPVSASFGVVAMPECEVNDAFELLQVADKALYEAKTRGRNRVCVAS